MIPLETLRAAPKVLLHDHLDGGLRPTTIVEQAVTLTPGLESPTISPMHDKDWVAVRAMVPRGRTNAIMDELYDIGARAILVTEITACRL